MVEEFSNLQVANIYPESMHFHTPQNSYVGSYVGKKSARRIQVSPIGSVQDNGNITFNVQPPRGFISSTPRLHYTASISVTGNINAVLINGFSSLLSIFGLSSFPLNRLINSCNVSFGRYSYTTLPYQNVDVYAKMINAENAYFMGQSTKPDNMTFYSASSLDNVLKVGSDIVSGSGIDSRGIGNRYVTSNLLYANNTITFNLDVYELLQAEPYQFLDPLNANPFYNMPITRIDLQLGTLNSIFSYGGIPTLVAGGFGLTITTTTPNLMIEFDSFSPDDLVQIPQQIVYQNITPVVLTEFNTTALNPGVPITHTSQSYSFNNVPNMFALYCIATRAQAGSTAGTSDFFLPIRALNITCNNTVGIFSELLPFDLYSISSKNGYNQKYSSFFGSRLSISAAIAAESPQVLTGNGCVFYFKPSDLGVDDLRANQNAPLTLNFTMTIGNDTGFTVAGSKTIYLVQLNETQTIARNGEYDRVLVSINSEKLLDPNNKIIYDKSNMMRNVVSGGSFFGDIWSGIKKVASNVLPTLSRTARKTFTPIVKNFAPGFSHGLIDEANKAAERAGYGLNAGGELIKIGGKKKTKSKTKSKVNRKGGKVLEKDILELLD